MPTIVHGFLLGAVLLLGAAQSSAAPPVAEDSALAAYRERVITARRVAVELGHTPEEWTAAGVTLKAALGDPMFKQLDAVEQSRVHSGAGWAAIRVGDYIRARDQLLRATQLNPDASVDWLWLARLDDELGDYDSAAMAIVGFLRQWQLDDEQTVFVTQVVRKADPASVSRLVLLQALFDSNWQPKPLGASDLWYELALSQVRGKQMDQARATIARITSPDMLVRLRSDKRFDSLVDLKAPQFDVEKAAQAQLQTLREQSTNPPTVSQVAVDLTRALLSVGDNKAVLEFADQLLATPAGPDASFADAEQRAWIANNRATALSRLGRADEALAQMESAAAIGVNGGINVNQTLNLSHFYCAMGRGEQARVAAAKVAANMNGYGKVVQKLAEHCAALATGDSAAAAAAFAYLTDHQKDGPFPYLLALIRSNQMDEAARAVIRRLESEDDRGQMLYDLQDFLESKPLPGNVVLEARWQALVKRRDVVQALQQVGRTQHYDIYGN
jgi:tetratricopeptide (TPR) repeat protein